MQKIIQKVFHGPLQDRGGAPLKTAAQYPREGFLQFLHLAKSGSNPRGDWKPKPFRIRMQAECEKILSYYEIMLSSCENTSKIRGFKFSYN
jgi:hypothetical protein